MTMIFERSASVNALFPSKDRCRTSRSPGSQFTSWAEAGLASVVPSRAQPRERRKRAYPQRISRRAFDPTVRPAHSFYRATAARGRLQTKGPAESAGLTVAPDKTHLSQQRFRPRWRARDQRPRGGAYNSSLRSCLTPSRGPDKFSRPPPQCQRYNHAHSANSPCNSFSGNGMHGR